MSDLTVYQQAGNMIRSAKRVTVFTGSGISVESGIPPFRGKDGIYNKYDSRYFDISYFHRETEKCWQLLKEIFFDHLGKAQPNYAHNAVAKLEAQGIVTTVITQNIDNLHHKAGSKEVYEFHGNSQMLTCLKCGVKTPVSPEILNVLPPLCNSCNGILKPDFVFFGEGIPSGAYTRSIYEAETSDVFLIIGTTGEVMPASLIPQMAKRNGAGIIEVNPNESNFTGVITDVFLREKAVAGMQNLMEELGIEV